MTNGRALLARIRAEHARRDECEGHVFRCLTNEEAIAAGRSLLKRWHCERCDSYFDASFAIAYRQGLEHGAAGHALDSDNQEKR